MIKNNTKIEIFTEKKETFKNRFLFRLFKLFSKSFKHNAEGMISGWWQDWMFDYRAWDMLNKSYPAEKGKFWLTKCHSSTSYHRQLCNTSNLRWGTTTPVFSKTEKGEREALLTITLWQGQEFISSAQFIFVEKAHNYCKLNNRKV